MCAYVCGCVLSGKWSANYAGNMRKQGAYTQSLIVFVVVASSAFAAARFGAPKTMQRKFAD